MKKTALLVVFCLLASVCLTACGGKEVIESGAGKIETNTVENAKKSANDTAEIFVQSLLKSDFDSALTAMCMPAGSFVTAADIEWYLPRSSFSDILDIDYETYTVSSDKKTGKTEIANINVIVTSTEKTENGAEPETTSIGVPVQLNDQNEWFVNASDFYFTNFTFRTAGKGTTVKVNGTEVDEKYISNKTAGDLGLAYEYTLPYIGKQDAVISISSENFDYEQKLTPVSNNADSDVESVFAEASDTDEILKFIKDSWNNGYKESLGGASASDFQKYISSDADTTVSQAMYDGYHALVKPNSGLSSDADYDHLLTQCLPSDQSKANWVTGDTLYIPFKYELTWTYKLANYHESMKRYSSAELKYENGEYKFYALTDPELFTAANQFTAKW